MASLKQLFSQSVVYGLSTVITRLLNYLLVPIHTRVFSNPESYGIITELYAFALLLNNPIRIGSILPSSTSFFLHRS